MLTEEPTATTPTVEKLAVGAEKKSESPIRRILIESALIVSTLCER
jgi:hypothetical protein